MQNGIPITQGFSYIQPVGFFASSFGEKDEGIIGHM
jgi:hypothetical protein